MITAQRLSGDSAEYMYLVTPLAMNYAADDSYGNSTRVIIGDIT